MSRYEQPTAPSSSPKTCVFCREPIAGVARSTLECGHDMHTACFARLVSTAHRTSCSECATCATSFSDAVRAGGYTVNTDADVDLRASIMHALQHERLKAGAPARARARTAGALMRARARARTQTSQPIP